MPHPISLTMCLPGKAASRRAYCILGVIVLIGFLISSVAATEGTTDSVDQTADTGRILSDSVDENGGIIYGDGYAYFLHADTGWIMDHALEAAFEANSVFYPQGYRPDAAPVYIVSMIWYKDSSVTIADIIKAYTQSFSSHFDDAKVEMFPSLPTASGDSVAVRYCAAPSYNYYEKTAFCDAPGVVVAIQMKSQQQENFQNSDSNFANTVKSYRFLTNNVRFRFPETGADSTSPPDSTAGVKDSL